MRLLIVSNRLPITVIEKEGRLRFQNSSGGLVSGLSAYLDSLKGSSFTRANHIWVGWPGTVVEDKSKKKLSTKLQDDFDAYPVFLAEETMEKFYHGFCNKTIWPLFHYFTSYVEYDEECWEHYQRVNEAFGDAVIEIIKPDDIIWIHDYHLMLLPKILRLKISNPIGFFLHIPFPTFEIFRLLPGTWRREILQGLLGADLIGFHSYDYTQYFLRCVLRILGYEHNMGQIIINDRIIKAETFPMGIDFQKFYNAVNSPEVQKEKNEFQKTLGNFKIILSIDRLDYTKGILNRLRGYEAFLDKNPQWHRKVILVLIAVPSRIGIEHYREMKRQIDELVGKINGRFGSINWTPILYQFKFVPFNQLVALYNISDVALITPLRDGMNLIAKEYISAKADSAGVLILSEMAGAAKELGEAIIINPNNLPEITDALKIALEMPKEEQLKRNQVMQKRLKRYDVVKWADDFIQDLLSLKENQKNFNAKLLSSAIRNRLIKDFSQANRRLIILDYDGTLVPFVDQPQMASPDEQLLEILQSLAENPKNEIVLISGRDKDTLQNWFGKLDIGLVAEHGVWLKEKNKDWDIIKPLTNDWKSKIIPLLEVYTDRLPGSFIEEKEFSVAWHYRMAEPELGSLRAKELTDYLLNFIANIDIQVQQGKKVVEITNAGINKGAAGLQWIGKKDFDFILAIGDDWTDENLFEVLPERAYSIKVGMVETHARFSLYNHTEVIELLKNLLEVNGN
ncbi:MAG TPA: bifunctional alpha,alpha-trehalose-phosphate synthase (UDP-forming)/trehalose-phosphatase [Candidatus Marinimicrobia bacterium]|nr:bifunctional alpha,alpha-trehalose-phosphate synthase (UDP-forming)/trehalose-phosphatase [Candidatus Neomarinimicrobiota bacterium]